MQNRKPTYPSTASSHKHELFSIIDSSAQMPVQIEELPLSVIIERKTPSYEGFLDTRVKEKIHAHQDMVQDISSQIKEYQETPHRPGRKETDSLIQAFLDKNPKIRRPGPISELQEIKKVADHSVEKDEEIVSETLAKIHLQQNNTHEALRIYRKLSLLFPEKSAYFDAQISSIHSK